MDPFDIAPLQLQEFINRLTPRQMQIVELLAHGHTITETASILSIGRETAKFHIQKACRKTQVDNRIQLIVLYTRWKSTAKDKETL